MSRPKSGTLFLCMSFLVNNIVHMFEEWAPKWAAWEKDNVGLQIGDPDQKISRVLVALDVTPEIVQEAISKKADLLVSHHPLLFRPLSSITSNDNIGDLVIQLVRNKISLFSAHTNLDFSKDGVSFTLAQKLGLKNIEFLTPLKNSLAKIIVFVPDQYVEQVRNTMSEAGAGVIGQYSSCSFSSKGSGSFLSSPTASPFFGKPGTLETVEEIRLEMVAPRARVKNIVQAIKSVHPYEEVAYDVYSLDTPNMNFGMGALGALPKPQPLTQFLKNVKKILGSPMLRFTGNSRDFVQRVAVCGGSGSELLADAIGRQADVFITADVKYHAFHSSSKRIALVDAGHWETEHLILQTIANRIQDCAQKAHEDITVFVTKHNTNPIETI